MGRKDLLGCCVRLVIREVLGSLELVENHRPSNPALFLFFDGCRLGVMRDSAKSDHRKIIKERMRVDGGAARVCRGCNRLGPIRRGLQKDSKTECFLVHEGVKLLLTRAGQRCPTTTAVCWPLLSHLPPACPRPRVRCTDQPRQSADDGVIEWAV